MNRSAPPGSGLPLALAASLAASCGQTGGDPPSIGGNGGAGTSGCVQYGSCTCCAGESTWFLDADLDGLGDPEQPVGECTCVESIGALSPRSGVAYGARDCDPSVPSVLACVDGDGDGLGAGEPACFPAPAPAGYAPCGGDCDDDDPGITVSGRDSVCSCERLVQPPQVPPEPTCPDGVDLFFSDIVVCQRTGCPVSAAVRVANAGGVMAEAPIEVDLDGDVSVIQKDVPPGGASGWLWLFSQAFQTIIAEIPMDDCDPSSNFVLVNAEICLE